MNEGLNENLKHEWEQKLKEVGLPEELPPIGGDLEEVPEDRITNMADSSHPSFEETVFDAAEPSMKICLDQFSALSEEKQKLILEDIKKHQDGTMTLADIKKRVFSFITGNEIFDTLSAVDAEKPFVPHLPSGETDKEIDDNRAKNIDALIEKMEKISRDNNVASKEDIVN